MPGPRLPAMRQPSTRALPPSQTETAQRSDWAIRDAFTRGKEGCQTYGCVGGVVGVLGRRLREARRLHEGDGGGKGAVRSVVVGLGAVE